ncbi:MAG: CDP-alcohol phosphatidyltransferase family protein [Cytophagales bacterium]|nr:CDP-alcohol phosphatidyltransferase family protein [Cytophagales bacterium]
MTKHIPNILTCCNLICGCIGIIYVFDGQMFVASWMIAFAAVFDFLDGFAARLLKASSPIGKDLDSLADMVTFGVLPGFIVFGLLKSNVPTSEWGRWMPFVSLMIPLFSALRLAKFNNDPRQSTVFYGLPTPANAVFFGSFPLILKYDDSILSLGLLDSTLLLILTLGSSILMVADVPLIALKFKSFGFRDNIFRYLLIFLSLFVGLLFSFWAIPLVIILYVFLSLIENFTSKKLE